MSNVQQPFREIVHYTVKDPASFTAINERAAHALRPLTEGMGWWSHWRGEDAAERAEVVAWSSPATAYAAAETMERHPSMRFFMEALDEIKFMSHYHVENVPDWRALDQAGVLELALVDLGDAASAEPAHRDLHAALTRRPGVRMTWRHLCFLHWRVPPAALRGLLPRGLELDTFDGERIDATPVIAAAMMEALDARSASARELR